VSQAENMATPTGLQTENSRTAIEQKTEVLREKAQERRCQTLFVQQITKEKEPC